MEALAKGSIQLCRMKTASLLNKYYKNEGILNRENTLKVFLESWAESLITTDLSKEIPWISIDQREAELLAIKVGGLKKILPNGPARVIRVRTGPFGRIFLKPPTLMAGSSAVLWPTKTHSASLERSKPPLLTHTLFKSLAALLMFSITIQSDLISIGLIL